MLVLMLIVLMLVNVVMSMLVLSMLVVLIHESPPMCLIINHPPPSLDNPHQRPSLLPQQRRPPLPPRQTVTIEKHLDDGAAIITNGVGQQMQVNKTGKDPPISRPLVPPQHRRQRLIRSSSIRRPGSNPIDKHDKSAPRRPSIQQGPQPTKESVGRSLAPLREEGGEEVRKVGYDDEGGRGRLVEGLEDALEGEDAGDEG
ncbi:hypothetical protein CDD80_2382 [Ophiocordyceps camponoti-rufipedis]|uniref:WH2 domain-containing protein n=1 Tax=Ophiocordyceps camponoti-rufipedis TaxID=2004952 RepID=A0A2C5XKE5_9HYPO|nr:hypothetical protein CDD80_2382 [Ophiocordyceps camponoti-rufipedis]